MRERVVAAAFVAASAPAALAADLQVPRDFHTIESAVEVSKAGDRIVVSGGLYGNVLIRRNDLTIVGHGATLASNVWIDGSRVTLSGFRIEASQRRDVGVIVTGDAVVISDNRFVGGAGAVSTPLMVKVGTGTRIEGNRFASSGISISRADQVVVRSNRVRGGKIQVYSDDAVVEANTGPVLEMGGHAMVARGNRVGTIRATGDDGVIEDNTVSGFIFAQGSRDAVRGNRLDGGGIRVTGDDCTIRDNAVRRSPQGVVVDGERFDISDNVIEVSSSRRERNLVGVSARCVGPGSAVVGNEVSHPGGDGIRVGLTGSIVAENVLRGSGVSESIDLQGSDNQVAGNQMVRTGPATGFSRGIRIGGSRNEVGANTVSGDVQDGIEILSGAGNIVTANEVSGARRSGIVVQAEAELTEVSLCNVSGCRIGLTNRSAGTSLRGSTISGNRAADVLDISGFRLFDGNTFDVLSHDERIFSR